MKEEEEIIAEYLGFETFKDMQNYFYKEGKDIDNYIVTKFAQLIEKEINKYL